MCSSYSFDLSSYFYYIAGITSNPQNHKVRTMAEKVSIKGIVTARKCNCCGHHEIGVTTRAGEYISLKPGMKIQIEFTKKNISKDQALEIYKAHIAEDNQQIFKITDSIPSNINVYGLPSEECWYILCSYHPHAHLISSSRLICISKNTGRILFDGSANDEG